MMAASTALVSVPALADEPSLHQVYQAADAGKLSEAQTMMQQVLVAHPNSGKAHFVEAELLAKQGEFQKAQGELATAERLSPGLPFAKPQSVQNLKTLLASAHAIQPTEAGHAQPVRAAEQSTIPWGMLVGGLGLIAFIALVARFMAQRNQIPAAGGMPAGFAPGAASPGYGAPLQPYGAGGVGPVGGVPGSGLGSRIMGGLATGAAVGAGVVAGEALMHHFMDGKDESSRLLPRDSGPISRDSYFNDLGGADFGVSDTSSWDDSSSGDSEWN